jgi:hypothetical protein
MATPSSTSRWQKSSVFCHFLAMQSTYADTVINSEGTVATGKGGVGRLELERIHRTGLARIGKGLAIVLCAVSWKANAKAHPAQTCYRVNVQLSSRIEAPPDLLRDGEDAASTIFAAIHVQLVWADQTHENSKAVAGCAGELTVHDLGVKIVPYAPANVSDAAVAMAMPYPDSSPRVVIFYDRLEPLLRWRPVPEATVLGYVLAHEITHVLQGIARHSEMGIMRARWTDNDFKLMRIKVLTFTTQGVQLIRERLALPDTSANSLVLPDATSDRLSPKEEL